MGDQGELFRDYGPEKPPRVSRGWKIAIGIAVLFVVISVTNDDTDTSPSRSVSSASDEDRQSRMACTHFRNIANDAELMTDAEIRAKMREVHDDASIATPAVRSAARDALAAITSGTTAEFESAITRLSAACSAAGW